MIRLQRLRDSGTGAACYAGSTLARLLAVTLYDAREGSTRDAATNAHAGWAVSSTTWRSTSTTTAAGWPAQIGGTGALAEQQRLHRLLLRSPRQSRRRRPANRRDRRVRLRGFDQPGPEVWAKNNPLNGGEDFNENDTLQATARRPRRVAARLRAGRRDRAVRGQHRQLGSMGHGAAEPLGPRPTGPPGAVPPRPQGHQRRHAISGAEQHPGGRFHRGLGEPGLHPGQLQRHDTSVEAEPNVATAMMADAITLLSNAFNDAMTMRPQRHDNPQRHRPPIASP